jgi:hypothetical protein
MVCFQESVTMETCLLSCCLAATKNLSKPVDKCTVWEQFQNLTSELISPRIQINPEKEADKAACVFTASIASMYRLSTSRITLLVLNNNLPGLESLLKHKRRFRKLWQVTRDPTCKRAVNLVAKTVRQMTSWKALERWEAEVGHCEVTPQALWPIAKSLVKRVGPKAPTTIHGPLGMTYHPNEKASMVVDCSENQFTSHDLWQKPWATGGDYSPSSPCICRNTPLRKVRPCDIHKLVNSMKLRKACGLDGIPNVFRKLQWGLSATEIWCERWNIKINEDRTQAIYFSYRLRLTEAYLTFNEQNIPFLNHVKYLGVIFDKRIIWTLHLEMTEAKDIRTFIRIYSLFKNEHLSANIKMTHHKTLIRSVMSYAWPARKLAADTYLLKLQRLQNKVLKPLKFLKVHTRLQFTHGFQPSIWLYNKIVQATSRSHAKSWGWTCSP